MAFRSRTQSVVTGTEVRKKFRRVKTARRNQGERARPEGFRGGHLCGYD